MTHDHSRTAPASNDATTEGTACFCYVNGNGQVVFDTHPSDQAHLSASATHEEQPLYRCRTYLNDLIPKEWRGKHGTFRTTRHTSQVTGKLVVSLSFTPD